MISPKEQAEQLMKIDNEIWDAHGWQSADYLLAHWNEYKIELLDKLASIVKLPPAIEAYRQQLHRVQDAVDRERTDEHPKPFYKYPVKMPLYAHQVRGANMALLTFGWVPPEAAERRAEA